MPPISVQKYSHTQTELVSKLFVVFIHSVITNIGEGEFIHPPTKYTVNFLQISTKGC